ncbi:MAG: hypothetical protein QXT82_10350 [Candidatus Caldarchaeum sp.]
MAQSGDKQYSSINLLNMEPEHPAHTAKQIVEDMHEGHRPKRKTKLTVSGGG